MNKLSDMSCSEFAAALSDRVPVPGGGGAAAMVGAYAAALCSMSANFTIGKKKYAAYEEELQSVLKETEEIRTRLLFLVEEDARNFEPLSRAYGIPKGAPGREEALEGALLAAVRPPLDMMKCIRRSVELLERMEVTGSSLMISDVGCGALLAAAALRSAGMNVFINTCSMHNREKASMIEKEADEILDEYVPRAEKVSERVTDVIRKKK